MRAILAVTVTVALVSAAPAAAAGPGDTVDPKIADGTAQSELDAARARWRAFDVDSYSYRAHVECFCGPDTVAPARLLVIDGRPIDPPRRLRRIATIPRLFRQVQHAIDDRVAALTVRYGKRGVPRTVRIDPSLMIADEEISYISSRVRRR